MVKLILEFRKRGVEVIITEKTAERAIKEAAKVRDYLFPRVDTGEKDGD